MSVSMYSWRFSLGLWSVFDASTTCPRETTVQYSNATLTSSWWALTLKRLALWAVWLHLGYSIVGDLIEEKVDDSNIYESPVSAKDMRGKLRTWWWGDQRMNYEWWMTIECWMNMWYVNKNKFEWMHTVHNCMLGPCRCTVHCTVQYVVYLLNLEVIP